MPRLTKATQLAAQQRRALVDEYGKLDAELAPLKGKISRRDEIAKLIRSWHADADAAETVTSAGDEYEVVLGACGMETRIANMSDVYKALGHARFLACAHVTLRSLEASGVDSAVVAGLTRKEQTGSRKLVVRVRSDG